VDRVAAQVLSDGQGGVVSDWEPRGGDERQFCAPGFDLPVGAFSRTPHGLFPQYHSSADDLELVTAEALGSSFRTVLQIIDILETNASYINRSPYGEPQLGRRGLYRNLPDGMNAETALLWVLSLSDGHHDLVSIADRSGLPFHEVRAGADALESHNLIEQLP
jgi:aminopeptidase-like protein